MPRPSALLVLLVALAGPLLTHAEAAEDLARSLIELRDPTHLEAPDGGIGDDPNVAATGRPGPSLDLISWAPASWEWPALAPLFEVGPGASPAPPTCRHEPSWPTGPTTRRLAWLQHFLI